MEYIKFEKFIKSTQYGYTADETFEDSGDVKYLRITDIVPYFVDKERVPFCNIDKKKMQQYLVKEGDLLIARTGATTGYNIVIDETFDNHIFASYLIRFNYDKEKLYPRYVKHVLKSDQWYGFVNNYIGGSAQPGMNAKTFGRFNFPYCEYNNQVKIANVLDRYDQLIYNNNQKIKLLEKIVSNIYKEWFVNFRIPNRDLTKRKKIKPHDWIIGENNEMTLPYDWHIGKLEEIGKFIRGKNITSEEMEAGDVPVISAGINPSGYHNKYNVNGNSLTISASGANAGFLKYNLENIWAADCSYFQDDSSIWFVYSSLCFIEKSIRNLQVGAAQPHVYPKNINKLNIIIPMKNDILNYNNLVKNYFEEIRELQKQNIVLINKRDMLLPRLISGILNLE